MIRIILRDYGKKGTSVTELNGLSNIFLEPLRISPLYAWNIYSYLSAKSAERIFGQWWGNAKAVACLFENF
jgi:hypothetical protein